MTSGDCWGHVVTARDLIGIPYINVLPVTTSLLMFVVVLPRLDPTDSVGSNLAMSL